MAAALLIVGKAPSTTIAALAASESSASVIAGSVTVVVVVAEFPAKSFIVPPFNASAVVDAWLRSSLSSPLWTVYVKRSVFVPVPDVYSTARSVSPVSNVNLGAPPAVVTFTTSSNTTCTLTVSPKPYVPSSVLVVMLLTPGLSSSLVTVTSCVDASVANALPAASTNCFEAVAFCVYATDTVASFTIAVVNPKVTVVPDTLTLVTAFVAALAVTVKSPTSGEPLTLSLIVSVTIFVPAVAAALLIVGATASTTIPAMLDNDPAPPASGNVVTTLFPSLSSIVPLFNVKGLLAL